MGGREPEPVAETQRVHRNSWCRFSVAQCRPQKCTYNNNNN